MERPENSTLFAGGFIFAESPDHEAPDATIVWTAAMDPGVLQVTITPTESNDPGRLDPERIMQFLSVVVGSDGKEHAVLSDGPHHIRLDLGGGTLIGMSPVRLRFEFEGLKGSEAKIMPFRRFLNLCRCRQFSKSLYPHDPMIDKGITLLRVADAMAGGASHREIGNMLYGSFRNDEWSGESDSRRSRIRRLVNQAKMMASGGYRSLLSRIYKG